jgi:ribosomal RNA-processing protein 9
MNKKKPIFSLKGCHKDNSWLLSSASVRNSDLLATGSYDGFVNFYKFNKDEKTLEKTHEIGDMPGCINDLKFSNSRGDLMLAVSHSEEEKFGRWHV